jgi:hypothetical protein
MQFKIDDGTVTMTVEDAVVIEQKNPVKSVNGVFPDENGNVQIDIPECKVKTVNHITPDENGNVQIDIESVVLETLIDLKVAPVILDGDNSVLVDGEDAILLNM